MGQKTFSTSCKDIFIFKPGSKRYFQKGFAAQCIFAHPKNVIVSMLVDEDSHVRRARVQKIHCLHSKTEKETLPSPISLLMCQCCPPPLDLTAKIYQHLVKVEAVEISEPPTTRSLTIQQLDNVIDEPLQMN